MSITITQQAIELDKLFATPRQWVQGYVALDSLGYMVKAGSPKAACWCLSGGIIKVSDQHSSELRRLAKDLTKVGHLTEFNDDPKTEFKDIKRFTSALIRYTRANRLGRFLLRHFGRKY